MGLFDTIGVILLIGGAVVTWSIFTENTRTRIMKEKYGLEYREEATTEQH